MALSNWSNSRDKAKSALMTYSRQSSPEAAITSIRRTLPDAFETLWARSSNGGAIDVVDMFSGAGGMSAGFRAVNGIHPFFNQLLAIDIDEAANRTYALNLGLTPEALDIERLSHELGELDILLAERGRRPEAPLVLIGCAPCQGFSSHRNTNGSADPRNGLFVDFARIAAHLEADFVIVENVPELLTDQNWGTVQTARTILEAAGYNVHVTVHNMAEFGVPQERFRAVILAAKQPFSPPKGSLSRDQFRTVRRAIGRLTPVQPGVPDRHDPMHVSAGHRPSTIETIRTVPRDGGNRPMDGGPKGLAALSARQGKSAYEDVYGRLSWDKPSITITAYSRNPASGRFVHPEQDRGLTVREVANLQSFPPDYEFVGSFDERFRQIGNAVPPLFGAQLALTALECLLSPPAAPVSPGITRSLGKSFSRLIPSLKAGSHRLILATEGTTNDADSD